MSASLKSVSEDSKNAVQDIKADLDSAASTAAKAARKISDDVVDAAQDAADNVAAAARDTGAKASKQLKATTASAQSALQRTGAYSHQLSDKAVEAGVELVGALGKYLRAYPGTTLVFGTLAGVLLGRVLTSTSAKRR